MKRHGAVVGAMMVVVVLLLVQPSWGDEVSAPLRDVAVIQNGEGAARILFRSEPDFGDRQSVALWKGMLTLTTSGPAADRRVALRIHPVTGAWNPGSADWNSGWTRPGGDFDDELFASAEVSYQSGAATVVFDVTAMLKEIVEYDFVAHGFILTVHPREGAGIDVSDLPRFGSLNSAALSVEFRGLPNRTRS